MLLFFGVFLFLVFVFFFVIFKEMRKWCYCCHKSLLHSFLSMAKIDKSAFEEKQKKKEKIGHVRDLFLKGKLLLCTIYQ